MSDLAHLTRLIQEFRDARDWAQFHNPKEFALSLVLEASELLEIFQWQDGPQAIASTVEQRRGDIADELSDVLYWVLLTASELKIDMRAAFEAKMARNAEKYPVEKARGSNLKYTQL